jgi:hypothetical protein
MKTIENSITVEVPVSRAYNQWTQFEEFHLFMEGVKEVKQVDDKRLHWKAEIAGMTKEWDAEILRAGSRSAHCLAQHGRGKELRHDQLHFAWHESDKSESAPGI